MERGGRKRRTGRAGSRMSEDAFLQALFARMPSPPKKLAIPPGDDCAGYDLGRGRILLIAVDQIVEKRHYLAEGPSAATPEQVGRKLLARNLSDIAAMGGRPLHCLTAVSLGPGHDESWLRRFFEGVLTLCGQWNVALIGGDLASAPEDTVAALTITGEANSKTVCRRSGARLGDLLFATGRFGRSFQSGRHLSFTPRLREGQWLSARRFARAMIDVSDGLLLDAWRLCRASGVGLALDVSSIPRRTAATTAEEALHNGEDYELLFAVSKRKAKSLVALWPFARLPLTEIGEFFPARSPTVMDRRGAVLSRGEPMGFDHFRTRED